MNQRNLTTDEIENALDQLDARDDRQRENIVSLAAQADEILSRYGDNDALSDSDTERITTIEAELARAQRGAESRTRLRDALERGAVAVESPHEDPAPQPTLRRGGFRSRRGRNVWSAPLERDGIRTRALTAVEAVENCPTFVREAATAAVEDVSDTNGGETIAAWVIATSDPEYRSAFFKLMADPQRGHVGFTNGENRAFNQVTELHRSINSADAAGGYAVPFTLDQVWTNTNGAAVEDPVLTQFRVETIATDRWNGINHGGVTASWDGEAVEVSDDSPTFTQPSVKVHKLAAFVPVTFEAFDDIPMLESNLREVMVDEFRSKLAEAVTTGPGDGSDQPTGFLTALAGTSAEVAPRTAEVFAVEDVYDLLEALPARHRSSAQWFASLGTKNAMRQFAGDDGHAMLARLGDRTDVEYLLNRRLNECAYMPSASAIDPGTTADNHILAVGDTRRFIRVDRIGTTIELVPNLMGPNRRPTGERGFLAWGRWGSGLIDVNGWKVLNIATTA